MYISCFKISQIRPTTKQVSCCDSCHIDNEEFGYDLCAVDGPDGHCGNHSGGVCCVMSIYLGENPLTEEEWAALEGEVLPV